MWGWPARNQPGNHSLTLCWVLPVVRVQGTPSLEALKLQYYELMIRFHQHEGNYLEVCRCYR